MKKRNKKYKGKIMPYMCMYIIIIIIIIFSQTRWEKKKKNSKNENKFEVHRFIFYLGH